MRRPKKILLAGSDEDHIASLRYLLRTWGYGVSAAYSAAEAELLMLETPDLLMVVSPLEGARELLERSATPDTWTMLVAPDQRGGLPVDWIVDCALLFRNNYSSSELREHIKVLCARKRGGLGRRKIPRASSPHIGL